MAHHAPTKYLFYMSLLEIKAKDTPPSQRGPSKNRSGFEKVPGRKFFKWRNGEVITVDLEEFLNNHAHKFIKSSPGLTSSVIIDSAGGFYATDGDVTSSSNEPIVWSGIGFSDIPYGKSGIGIGLGYAGCDYIELPNGADSSWTKFLPDTLRGSATEGSQPLFGCLPVIMALAALSGSSRNVSDTLTTGFHRETSGPRAWRGSSTSKFKKGTGYVVSVLSYDNPNDALGCTQGELEAFATQIPIFHR